MTLADERREKPPGTGAGAPESEERPGDRRPPTRRRAVVEWAVIVLVALVAALLIKTFAIQAFYIPSGSMIPTLQVGDRVLVNKLAYDFHAVHQGDVIVFRRPPGDTSAQIDDLIKRVVALPGQKVFVSHCRVYVNGKEQAQRYLPAGWQQPSSSYCTTWPGDLPDPYTVPSGDYFVMGDNRSISYDSRYWGPLPGSYIVGRAFVRIWPFSRFGLL